MEPQIASSLTVDNWMCWTIWAMGMGRYSLQGGSDLGSQLIPFLYQVCTGWYSHTFACGGACIEVGRSHMDRLLLDHFQWLGVILCNSMPAIEVCVKLLETKAH